MFFFVVFYFVGMTNINLDYTEALDRVANSMGTHERHQRSMAQAMAEQAERVAVLERKLEEATAYGELTRAYLSEACGNMITKFVKVEDMAQRDETNREDLSAVQVGIHHNLECHSVVAARLEAVEVQLQNLLKGSQPPPGLDESETRPVGQTVQFELATPVGEGETRCWSKSVKRAVD